MDGMVINLYGPMSGRRHDMALQNHSQISAQMQNAQIEYDPKYTLASDKGFYNETHMKPMMTEPLTPEQEQANHEFSSMRVVKIKFVTIRKIICTDVNNLSMEVLELFFKHLGELTGLDSGHGVIASTQVLSVDEDIGHSALLCHLEKGRLRLGSSIDLV